MSALCALCALRPRAAALIVDEVTVEVCHDCGFRLLAVKVWL